MDIPANLSCTRLMCMLPVLFLSMGHRANASVAIPSHFLGCTVSDGGLSFNPCSMGTVQLPDPGNGIEGFSFGGSPQTFASPLGLDHFEYIAVTPGGGPSRIDLTQGLEIPWSYNFGLTATDPGIALNWNLRFGFGAMCTGYDVSTSGQGLGTFTGNGSAAVQQATQCPPADGSFFIGSYVFFDATVTSIQNGATLTANFPEGSVQINPLEAVPEPASFSLFLCSLGCMALIRKWRAR